MFEFCEVFAEADDIYRWVQTESGNASAVTLGFGTKAQLAVDEIVPGLISVVCCLLSCFVCFDAYVFCVLRLMTRRGERPRGTFCSMMALNSHGRVDPGAHTYVSLCQCSGWGKVFMQVEARAHRINCTS